MGVSDMKRFIINILVFFGVVAAVDVVAGKVFGYLQSNKAKGRTGVEYHVCKALNEDILIMGSSRALHHYVPQILEDSLGISCFNGGQDGNGIVMQYGRWKMISENKVPKLIIYDIEPSFDMAENDNDRYIDRLKPFASDKSVRAYMASLFPMERLKLESSMYRYNYKFLEILSDCVVSPTIQKGYIPLRGHIRPEMIDAKADASKTTSELDAVKLEYLERFISEAQGLGCKVVLVSSPYWKGHTQTDFSVIEELAEKYSVTFLNYAESELVENPDYFADSMHLNDDGANEFTKDLVTKLKAKI